MELRASDYKNRAELDAHVGSLMDKAGYVIVGTEDELKAKQLSATTSVWGVPCKIIG